MGRAISEVTIRRKFRTEAEADPNVLVNQYVNLTCSGPAYKVLEVLKHEHWWYAKLNSKSHGCYIGGTWRPGYVYLSSINYYSGDILNMYQSRIDNITKTMKD